PGLENRVFVAAVTPDGRPSAADVQMWIGKDTKGKQLATVATNAAGLGEVRITPKQEQFRQAGNGPRDIEMRGGRAQQWGPNFVLDFHTQAKDAQGHEATSTIELSSQPFGENVLLRLDKAIYQVGDRLNIDVRTSAGMPTVFIDVVRGGQIML